LRRRWFLLVIGAVLGAAAAYAYVSIQPPEYFSRADVAIVRTGFVVNLNPSFRTVSDTDPNTQALDQVSRRRSLAAIGGSLAFAEQVLEKLKSQLPEELQAPDALRERVNIKSDGDLFQIEVFAPSPELAALIANTWAEMYVNRINEVFGETPVTPASFDVQAAEAKKDYDAKQAALEAFLGTSPVDRLTRERDLLNLQLSDQVRLEGKLVQLQADVESLQSLIRSGQGNATAGEELTRVLLAANTFNNSGQLPLQMDVPFNGLQAETSREQQIAQLDALLVSIQERRAGLSGSTKTNLYHKLSSVQQQLERAQAQAKELQAGRDLAWNIYQLFQTKVGETSVANGTQNQLVRVANEALVPLRPVDSRIFIKTALGAFAGLVLGAAVALFVRAN
jgi:uncharacterized protein involved in exopolysaccharide biosynthesis